MKAWRIPIIVFMLFSTIGLGTCGFGVYEKRKSAEEKRENIRLIEEFARSYSANTSWLDEIRKAGIISISSVQEQMPSGSNVLFDERVTDIIKNSNGTYDVVISPRVWLGRRLRITLNCSDDIVDVIRGKKPDNPFPASAIIGNIQGAGAKDYTGDDGMKRTEIVVRGRCVAAKPFSAS